MTKRFLDTLEIASPCKASWDDMAGSDRVRYCLHCDRNVYNVAELTRHETEAIVRRTEGRVCLRLYRREDGTVLTADCPLGRRRKWIRTAVAGGLAAIGLSWAMYEPPPRKHKHILGRVRVRPLVKDTPMADADVMPNAKD